MSKTKEIHQYNGTSWGQAIPIGADAANVDVATQEGTQVPLQDVLGAPSALEPSMKTQIDSKVDAEGGDVAHTVVNDQTTPITVYDLDDDEDSEKLISDDLSTDTDMVVMSGDGENLTSMWSKFNRFRKRVDNKFKKFLVDSVAGVTPGASSDKKGYSTQALNNYFSSVIGYTSAADVSQTGSIASQLSSLNNNKTNKSDSIKNITRSGTTFTATRANGTTFTFTQQDTQGLVGAKWISGSVTNVSLSASSIKVQALASNLTQYGPLIFIANLIINQASSGGSTYAYISLAGYYTSSGTAYAKLTNRSSATATCNISYGIQVMK